MIKINLTWKYAGAEKPSLKNVNLEVESGEFIGVIGPIDSGKSTLCYSIASLIPNFFPGEMEGDVIVNGLNTKDHKISEFASKVGLVFQDPLRQITGAGINVEEELALGLENLGISRREMKRRIKYIIKATGLEGLEKRSPFELSGGQQQKVAIASILIMEPEILVLDEPTAQLDPLGTSIVWELIMSLTRKDITIIIVSNKLDKLAEFSDRIVLMDDGKIVKEGDPYSILTNIELMKNHDMIPPSVTELSYRLRSRGMWKDKLAITISQAEKVVRKMLKWSP